MVSRLEALADAIAVQNNYLEPSSEAYQTRNPGLLVPADKLQQVNANGARIFSSSIGGYRALLSHLEVKCKKPGLTLKDLLKAFRFVVVPRVIEFLQEALEDQFINEQTPLQFFLG